MELGEKISQGSETSCSGLGTQVTWPLCLLHSSDLQCLPTVDALECQKDGLLVSESLFIILSM